jgi:serine/threonine-protein kinase
MDESSSLLEGLSEEAVWRLEAACCRFEHDWQAGSRPQLEHFLAGVEGPERQALLQELLRLDVYYRRQAGEDPSATDYQHLWPEAAALLPDDLPDSPPAKRLQPPPPPSPRHPVNRQARNPHDTDHNLLFGVLALQADFIDNETFVRACALWAADKGRPLAQVLVDQGWLSSEDRADVERLLARKLSKHCGDVQASLAEAVGGSPATTSLAGIGDAEVQASLVAAAAVAASGQTIDEPPRWAGPRYRVLRPHAEGGLGEVSVAEDTELHRQVALKEIKLRHAHQEASRRRFVLEAEITGGLEHPGVVPVYGLGVYPDGRLYYAMRFIQGDTLAAACQRFHTAEAVAFDALEFRQLLGRFVDVCQAVAYAHSRGVLHRDIKPANVMLGKFGETLLVDWGLAKVVGRAAGAVAGGVEEETLRPAAGSERVETVAGAAVGTPGFMSPEQAAGEVERLSPATDVYSLGAMLYMLLTSQAPLRGTITEVLQRTQEGAWLPPRKVKAAVPAALDAICRKAMALRPQERYASALELAADLDHWLADEAVSAYREPAGARLRRWMRKHPRRVTAAGVLLLATVISLTIGTVLLELAKREAEDNLNDAREAVDKCLNGVSENFLLDEPAMQPMRQDLLLQAEEYGRKSLKKHPGDLRAGKQYAKTLRLLGELYGQVRGRHREDEGIALVKRAMELYEELLKQVPEDREVRFGLAHAHYALADLRLQQGALEDGEKEVSRAIELLERLTAEEPDNESFRCRLAWSYNLWATAKWYRGDVASGLEDSQKALEIAELSLSASRFKVIHTSMSLGGFNTILGRQLHHFVDEKESLVLLPQAYSNRGIMLHGAGRNTEADWVLQKATALDRWLVNQCPGLSQFRHALALALLHTGRVQVELGRPSRGEPALREALELARKNDDPTVPEYREVLLQTAGSLGEDLFVCGQTAEAAKLLREALTVPEDAGTSGSEDRTALTWRARFHYVLGCLEAESGHLAEGLQDCEEARKEQEQALEEAPGDPSLRGAWLGTREQLTLCRFLKGDIDRDTCIAEQRSVLAARAALAGPLPTRAPRFQSQLAASAALRARLLLEGGRSDEALACVDEVLPDHERFVREEQERAKKRAATNNLPAKPDPNEEMWPVYLQVRPVELTDLELRRQWALLLARRGAALAGVRRGREAAEAVSQAVALTEGLLRGDHEPRPLPASPLSVWLRCPPATPLSVWSFFAGELWRQEPCYLYDLACQLTLASSLPGNAGLEDPAGQAVQALRALIASGFDNSYKLRTDRGLAPLRQRPDFQKLVAGLESRARNKEPF